MCQPVRGLVEFAVRPRARSARQRHCGRGARQLCRPCFRNRYGRWCGLGQDCAVSPPVQQVPLLARDEIYRRQPSFRVGGDGDQHRLQPSGQCLDSRRVEHVGAILHRPADARGLATAGVPLGQRKRQIHSRGVSFDWYGSDVQIAQSEAGGDVVLPGQHHLDQWMMGQ